MIATIQRFLLAIADFALRRGLLATAPGRALFETAYQAYKSVLEAPAVESLHPFVGPGDWVIDVGANAGFFSRRFARWTTDGGRVIAIEPAPDNIARLNANLARWGLGGRVDVIAAAATDIDGEATLALDPGNPADHRLSDTGETVRAVTLDRLVTDYGAPRICLVKIDVQGAEPMVLAGARALIARDKPVLVIEVSEQIESVADVPRPRHRERPLQDLRRQLRLGRVRPVPRHRGDRRGPGRPDTAARSTRRPGPPRHPAGVGTGRSRGAGSGPDPHHEEARQGHARGPRPVPFRSAVGEIRMADVDVHTETQVHSGIHHRVYRWVLSWSGPPAGDLGAVHPRLCRGIVLRRPAGRVADRHGAGETEPRAVVCAGVHAGIGDRRAGRLPHRVGVVALDRGLGVRSPRRGRVHGGEFPIVEVKYQENAFLALFTAGFTPIPFKVFTIAAGVFEVGAGGVRGGGAGRPGVPVLLVAELVKRLGPRVQPFIEKYLGWLTLAFAALLILGFWAIKVAH